MMDFHCHLDLFEDPRSLIRACESQGIYVLAVTTTPTAWRGSTALVRGCRRVRLALGLHPELAARRRHEMPLFERLLPETRYVGEVGLDGTPDHRGGAADQEFVFAAVLAACARESGKIMSIHSRGAVDPVLDLIAAFPDAGTPVLHWFTGGKRQLQRAISMGCWFSVGEPMIRSRRGREAITTMPRGRVLIETDGPFAKGADRAPLSPLDSPRALALLADLWGEPVESARDTVRTALRDLLVGDLTPTPPDDGTDPAQQDGTSA